jgi:Arc/MetJ family transcription regulator
MRTNIVIDDELMDEALRLSGARTKREAIDLALRTLIRLRRQEGLRALRGIGWKGDLEAMRLDG